MDKKKIGLIIGIILFIGILVTITVIYNSGNGNQKELEEEAADVGIVKINDENFEEEMLNTDKIVVIDFYENMCPPCTSIIPTIINIAKSSDKVKVGMVNISDKNTNDLAKKYEISATPTILILKDGKEVEKFVGATNEGNIMDIIDQQMESKNEK